MNLKNILPSGKLLRARGRKFDGKHYGEVGSFETKKRANEVADSYRRDGKSARVVHVKKRIIQGDPRNYPYHLFVRGKNR